MPGSEQAVRKIQQIAERKNIAAKTGIAGLRRSIRYGQLKDHHHNEIFLLR